MGLTNALKGITGEFEIGRMLGAFGVTTYIVSAPAFQFYEVWRNGHFDVIAFCAAYPAGLAAALGATAGSIALKDRNVAVARQTADNPPAPTNVAGNLNAQNVEHVNVEGQSA